MTQRNLLDFCGIVNYMLICFSHVVEANRRKISNFTLGTMVIFIFEVSPTFFLLLKAITK